MVDVSISDHSLVYTILNSPHPDFDLEKFAWENLKFDSDAFLQDLHNASFNGTEFFHDVNDKLFAFESLYLDIMGTHL